MVARVSLPHARDVFHRGVRLRPSWAMRREIGFGHVAGEDRRLRAEEEKVARDQLFIVGQRRGDGRLSRIQMRQEFLDHGSLGFGGFGAGAHFFLQAVAPFLQRREIGQHQLGVDHLDVAHGIDRAADVMDVAILETAHHLHDRVHFADMAEELVAEPFARARAFHQPRDVHELDRGRDDLLRAGQLREHFEPRIGHGHDPEIRVDRAKRVVRRLRFSRAGDGVEERGFPDVRQSDDSSAQHKAPTLRREHATRNVEER